MMARTCLDSGTLCGRLFFTRIAGNDHNSPAISSQRMPATSERLWPLNSNTLMHAAIGPPTASHASHNTLISASDSDRSRAISLAGCATPAHGEAATMSRWHSQLKNFDSTANVRLAWIGRPSATCSIRAMTSRRLMSWTVRWRHPGNTMSRRMCSVCRWVFGRVRRFACFSMKSFASRSTVSAATSAAVCVAVALAARLSAAGSLPTATSCSAAAAASRAAARLSVLSSVSLAGRLSGRRKRTHQPRAPDGWTTQRKPVLPSGTS